MGSLLYTQHHQQCTGTSVYDMKLSAPHGNLHNYRPTRILRSFTAPYLLVLTSVASCAFTVAAPAVWNSLSVISRPTYSFAL